MTKRHAKITISLPPEDLATADRLALKLDRSRSWIRAEALRRFAGEQDRGAREVLDPIRRIQLDRDRSLTAEARIHEAEEVAVVQGITAGPVNEPRIFRGYDAFAAWRRGVNAP